MLDPQVGAKNISTVVLDPQVGAKKISTGVLDPRTGAAFLSRGRGRVGGVLDPHAGAAFLSVLGSLRSRVPHSGVTVGGRPV